MLAAVAAAHLVTPGHALWVRALYVAPWLVLLVLLWSAFRAPRRAVLADRARTEVTGDEPESHPLEAEMLYGFIQKTTQLDPHRKPGPQLVLLAQTGFGLQAAAILDADLREIYQIGEWFNDLQEVLQNVYVFETASEDRELGLMRRVLRMGELPIGALLLRGEISAMTANALAAVISISFDRYHAFANESRTESARQTEQLRTTVLDSLAHAYKTPLTAIEAASGGLAAMGNLTKAQADLVQLIEEQAEQLSQLTTRLLTTARLEAGELVLHAERVWLAPLIDDVVASLRRQLTNHFIQVALSHDDLALCCDRGLLVALLTQYLDNASKYAEANTVVTIEAAEHQDAVVFSVHTYGPVIPGSDLERIFDRYYRCSVMATKAPGTGIGLSVAKRAAQAHAGRVWVTSDANAGTTFYASFPASQESAVAA